VITLNYLIKKNTKNKLLFNSRDQSGDTPIMKSIIEGNYEVTKILRFYSNLTLSNNLKQNIFHLCAFNNNSSVINLFSFFLKNPILNEVDFLNSTPLKYAILNNNILSFKFLCHLGCNINIQDKNGDSPVF
jgi:ankyrin repeat protein